MCGETDFRVSRSWKNHLTYDYLRQSATHFIDFCSRYGISLIQGLHYEDDSCFVDGIHLNRLGNMVLAKVLFEKIKVKLQEDSYMDNSANQ
jgi:hypothetical protein